jgi:hypothetical protein
MPEDRGNELPHFKREDVRAKYHELDEALTEFAHHLREIEKKWRLLTRLRLLSAWLAVSGVPDLLDQSGLLDELSEALKAADANLLEQADSLENQIQTWENGIAVAAGQLVPSPGWNRPLDEAALRMVLHREGIAPAERSLPLPDDTYTGIAGLSRCYTLTVTHNEKTRSVFAKFDEIDRARSEWEAIARMRRLPLPRELILPLRTNEPGDGVIVSETAATTRSKTCVTLARYLTDNLMIAAKNCQDSLKLTIVPLRQYYSLHVRHDDDHLGRMRERWSDVFPGLITQLHRFADGAGAPSQAHDESPLPRWCTAASKHWKANDTAWSSQRMDLPGFGTNCFNPIIWVEITRRKRISTSLKRSRVHGDLNLTNILVCPTADGTPDGVYIVDFANEDPAQMTAVDLARFEVAFWHEVYFPIAKRDNPTHWLVHFGLILEHLDGRKSLSKDEIDPIAYRCATLVKLFRQLAFATLRPEPKSRSYMFEDYFYSLFFIHLYFLGWPTIFGSSDHVCLSLGGAAAALQVISEPGRYSPGADEKFERPWEGKP